MPNRSKTLPGSSLICGNVRPWRSMKSWNESSLPVHATPMKLASSWNCTATSSTEGASRLQMLQVGAQNQNSVGLSATAAPSKVPPPTSGALNCRASGTTGASVMGASVGASVVSVSPVVVAVVSPGASVAGGSVTAVVASA